MSTSLRDHPTILLADDDPGFRLLLRLALERADFRVEEVNDGNATLASFERIRPDLVLLDIVMPGMDGYATCQALRGTPGGRSTPVVMLTSLDDAESIARAYDVGATDFVTKPVNYLILTQRLRYILRANRHLVQHDDLTGLPTRARFLKLLGQILVTATRHHELLAVMVVSLDHFKRFNETLGHAVGDELLSQVADRLSQAVRSGDLVSCHAQGDPYPISLEASDGGLARLGGDEFAIVLRQIDKLENSAVVARRILDSLSRPFRIGAHELHLSASIGISSFPCDGDNAEALVHRAEIATSHAKAQGRNRFQFHTESLNARTRRRFLVESRLRAALASENFELHYQPKFALPGRRLLGVEALLRWHDSELGPVSPAEFIGVAEETGLILPIGDWVLETAFRQTRAWRDQGYTGLTVAVNISPHQFHQQPLVARVAELLQRFGVDPCAIELEVTEGLLLDDTESTAATFRGLKELGVSIAIDDFGIGYSSLSYLKRFPLNTLKMDRSFIQDLRLGSRDMGITRAIVALARSLGLTAVAEGVETEEQLEALCAAGCDQAQGFLLSRPLPAASLTDCLASSLSRPPPDPLRTPEPDERLALAGPS